MSVKLTAAAIGRLAQAKRPHAAGDAFRSDHVRCIEIKDELMSAQASAMSLPPAATVLVVDDEPFLRVVLTEALNEAGYHAIEAENAEVAEQMLQAHSSIDVLITDINLDRRLDGHQVALKAYSLFPYLKVILMSGDLITGEQGASKAAMADGFLHKPFRLDDMWNLVESLLQPQSEASIQ